MGYKPTVAKDMLAGLLDILPFDSEQDPEDSVPISKLAETEKRQAEVEPSDPPLTKKPRSEGIEVPSSSHSKEPWSPVLMVGDRLMLADDSVINNIQVNAALFMVVLLPSDMVRMAEITNYENFVLIMQHFVLTIQHAHSFAAKVEAVKKELTQRTKEAEVQARHFMDKSKAAEAAQSQAEEKSKAAETIAKAAQAEAELKNALAFKEVEIKKADDKAYAKGQADANKGVEADVAVGAKSPILNEQVLDLTQDVGDEASKTVSPKATSEAKVTPAKRSLDKTLFEIDAKIATEKSAQLASEVVTTPLADVELSDKNAEDLNT
ncbi:hypothetical protein CsSME_00031474 [Camellia sinensis var. sinensis]